ncbi:MAG: efflux RND transporter periplasmic adaptor subunit [Ruthenibacterium sp.]
MLRRLKGSFRRMPKWKKIALIAVLLVLVIGGVFLMRAKAKKSVPTSTQGFERTTILAKTDLTEEVSVTGTVRSDSVTNVTSAANYKVAEILVKEGDQVTAGQTLCTLDTTELEKEITKKREALAENIATAQKAYDKAVLDRDDAQRKAVDNESATATARGIYQALESKYLAARNSVSAFQTAYDVALAQQQQSGNAYNVADVAALTSEAALATATQAGDPALAEYQARRDNDANLRIQAQAALDAANVALANATKTLADAKATCGYDALEKEYTAAQAAHEKERTALNALEDTYKRAKDAADVANDQLVKAKKSDEIDTLQEKLDDCVIMADTAGTITSVSAVVGSVAGGVTSNTLFVIQNTDHLKIGVTVDEYDIKKVKVGQSVTIQSDATGNAKIAGTVAQVSQTAVKTQDSSGFGAEITVDAKDSGLLIGMSAKVNIIIGGKQNVYAVPYDAVGIDDAGNSIVYVKEGDGFKPVQVTTGMETDYYIEISGDTLADGMEIRNSADETSINAPPMGDIMGGETVVAAPAVAMEPGGQG